jgi:L-arabinonolactonase
MITIDSICPTALILGENPLWDIAEQRIYWVDAMGRKVMRAIEDGSEFEAWDVPGEVGSMALRRDGGAVLALDTGLCFFDFATGRMDPIADPEQAQPHVRLNDGKIDSEGRFIVGSFDQEAFDISRPGVLRSSRGSLYRLDPDLTLHKLDGNFACANGPCWSRAEAQIFVTDTLRGRIWAADWNREAGTLSHKRPFLTFGSNEGIPDGATVDAEGFYWCAVIGPGEIRRYAPDGTLDRAIKLPVMGVTSVMFGGPELDVIYVTTMSDMPSHEFPATGSLFAVRGVGVRGIPAHRFAG